MIHPSISQSVMSRWLPLAATVPVLASATPASRFQNHHLFLSPKVLQKNLHNHMHAKFAAQSVSVAEDPCWNQAIVSWQEIPFGVLERQSGGYQKKRDLGNALASAKHYACHAVANCRIKSHKSYKQHDATLATACGEGL